jgi:hypothetical protein
VYSADTYFVQTAGGYMQVIRRAGDSGRERDSYPGAAELAGLRVEDVEGPGWDEGTAGYDRSGAGEKGMSARSRMDMRRLILALPLAMLGDRAVMVTLTYPGDWRRYCPDGVVWRVHAKRFEMAWRRRWPESRLVGLWGKEFQESGSPHLHWYVGLPAAVTADDYEGLRRQTLHGNGLERQFGVYKGRNRTPPSSGEFAMWLRGAWQHATGTAGGPDEQKHHRRGAQVRVFFYSLEAERSMDRVRVAMYLCGEAGKYGQKQPAAGFVNVGKYYGRFGVEDGFRPVVETEQVSADLAVELARRMEWWMFFHRQKSARRRGGQVRPSVGWTKRRPKDGLTALYLDAAGQARLRAGAERALERRRFYAGWRDPA